MRAIVMMLFMGIFFISGTPASAGVIYQNFEPENTLPVSLWTINNSSVGVVDRTEAVHLGRNAVKFTSSWHWSGIGFSAQTSTGPIDLKQENNDRLTFWTFAMPHINCYVYGCEKGTDNNVGVVFYDNGSYSTTGFEVWTTQTAAYQQWTKLHILFSQLPPDFNLRQVTKIEFKEFNPGKYFFDDIHAVREDRTYQDFEIGTRAGSQPSDYGWKWNDSDAVGLSSVNPDEPHYQGSHSWKLFTAGKWGGTGIQSQMQKYSNAGGTVSQTFWNVDLMPENNDRLTFWFYNESANGMDNNMGVQFYDNGSHNTDATKVVVWPKAGAVSGKWTRMTVLFKDILKQAPDFNLKDVNKIQIQNYWNGTVYIDDIQAAGPQPIIKEAAFKSGTVQWDPVPGAVNYRLQESLTGPNDGFSTVYSGPKTSYITKRLSKAWYRVRWEEGFADKNTIPYWSGWSDSAEYFPPSVTFKFQNLKTGQLVWDAVPQAGAYIVQSAPSKYGPWSELYKGPMPAAPLPANAGTWYRVRGINESQPGVAIDLGPWSRPQSYALGQGFVKAAGTQIKDANGSGDALVLNGVNLGGLFLIEPWMTGLGQGDTPRLIDDWSIRSALASRFNANITKSLMNTYQTAYFNETDVDYLLDQGITMVRLPFYYRLLQDDNGNWILNSSGQIDFSPLDRVVDMLSDHGIYVVLDLHGAPGYQNNDPNSGRGGVNLLFGADDVYRARTVSMWTEIAKHYKDNPWVLGYDLLNEPIGAAPNKNVLADFYDRIYQAIRTVDANHLIIMEGIWYDGAVDWDTLPVPSTRGWTNVLYQFHFYNWTYVDSNGQTVSADEHAPSHIAFVNAKLSDALLKQPAYNVPVMIGEFYGFGLKSVWDYYLSNFNAQNWGWTTWTYKYHDSPSNWGVANHVRFGEEPVKIQDDYLIDLSRKFSKYATADYHSPNATLRSMMTESAASVQNVPANKPYITMNETLFNAPGDSFTITGRNFGSASESHSITYRGDPLPIISWSDTEVRAYIRPSDSGSGTIHIVTPLGMSNGIDLIVQDGNTPGAPGSHFTFNPDGSFTFNGGSGDTPGTIQFYPAPCSDIPPGTRPCNNGDAAITAWTPAFIKGYLPPDTADASRHNIRGGNGGPLYPTMMRLNNRAPVLSPVANATVAVGATLIIRLTASDPDRDDFAYTVTPFPAGATMNGRTFTWKPTYHQEGVHTLTFQASDGQSASRQTATITVTWAAPDMKATAVSTTAASLPPNGTFAASAAVMNDSSLAAPASWITYHLSRDAVYGGEDDVVLAGKSLVGALSAFGTANAALTLRVPAISPFGNFYLCARADGFNTIMEKNEQNNGKCTAAALNVYGPDLVVTALSGPAAGVSGANIAITNTVKNQGQLNVGSSVLAFYLSQDAVITKSDRRIGARSVPAMAANAVSAVTSTIKIPSNVAAGTYWIGAIADESNVRAEQDESNNTKAGNTIAVTRP